MCTCNYHSTNAIHTYMQLCTDALQHVHCTCVCVYDSHTLYWKCQRHNFLYLNFWYSLTFIIESSKPAQKTFQVFKFVATYMYNVQKVTARIAYSMVINLGTNIPILQQHACSPVSHCACVVLTAMHTHTQLTSLWHLPLSPMIIYFAPDDSDRQNRAVKSVDKNFLNVSNIVIHVHVNTYMYVHEQYLILLVF